MSNFPALQRAAYREQLLKDAKAYDEAAQALEAEGHFKDARVKRKQASDLRLKVRLIR